MPRVCAFWRRAGSGGICAAGCGRICAGLSGMWAVVLAVAGAGRVGRPQSRAFWLVLGRTKAAKAFRTDGRRRSRNFGGGHGRAIRRADRTQSVMAMICGHLKSLSRKRDHQLGQRARDAAHSPPRSARTEAEIARDQAVPSPRKRKPDACGSGRDDHLGLTRQGRVCDGLCCLLQRNDR